MSRDKNVRAGRVQVGSHHRQEHGTPPRCSPHPGHHIFGVCCFYVSSLVSGKWISGVAKAGKHVSLQGGMRDHRQGAWGDFLAFLRAQIIEFARERRGYSYCIVRELVIPAVSPTYVLGQKLDTNPFFCHTTKTVPLYCSSK